MPTLNDILLTAQKRALAADLSYSGALTPQEAYYVFEHAPGAVIVDVRSHAELDFVGIIPSATSIEWLTYPDWEFNHYFVTQLKATVDPEALVMFICRSGHRSDQAAEAAQTAGYASSYNILEGFEGDKDGDGRRGQKNGWKAAQLPWTHK